MNFALSVAVVAVFVVAGYWTLLSTPSFGNLAPVPGSANPGLVASTTIPPGCNPTHGLPFPTRTALLIPDHNPTMSIAAGDHVDVTLEFNATAATVPVPGLKVYTPTVFVTMPTLSGTSFPVTLGNHTFTMTSAQWTSLSYHKLVTSNVSFNPAKNASLSTQKVGTMADTPYGTLLLQWRWSWNITFPNGSYVQGPWTISTYSIREGVFLPSIFKPAPYVDLESESPANELIGSIYTMHLGGDVSKRSFYLELESAIGVVVATKWVTDFKMTNATFNASMTLLGSNGYMAPGKYLLHIHDSCGALLYSKDLTLTYPPTATIHIVTNPATCGSITLSGTTYVNGQSAILVPSPTPFAFSFSACTGSTFSNYTHIGGIHITSQGLMVVSANGTIVANFRSS